MLIKTRGIVFRQQRYGETSVITDIYTEEKGLQSYIVSGVRKQRARVPASVLQLMSLVDMVAYYRDDRQRLNRIREIRPAHNFQSIPFDLKKGTIGMFLIEVIRKSVREAEGNTDLFQFLFQGFLDLDETNHAVANFHLAFLLELSRYLGFAPHVDGEPQDRFFDLREGVYLEQEPDHPDYLGEEEGVILAELSRAGYALSHTVSISRPLRRQLLGHLIDYYRLHIDNLSEIRSRRVLEEVLG